MSQQNRERAAGHTGRYAYFERQAGEAKARLDRVSADLTRYRGYAAQFKNSNVPDDVRSRIEYLERQFKELRARVGRAMHNAGRS